jgi:hypothetical protein
MILPWHLTCLPVVEHHFLGKGVPHRMSEQVEVCLLDTIPVLLPGDLRIAL